MTSLHDTDHMASRKREALVLFGADPNGQRLIIPIRTLERRSMDPHVAYNLSPNFAVRMGAISEWMVQKKCV